MKSEQLTPHDLAARWKMSRQTLAKWRWNGHGPTFYTLGTQVRYFVTDIESYEAAHMKRHTTTYDHKKKL